MRFRVTPGVPVALLNGWYSSAARLEVAVRTPGGFVTPFQPIFDAGAPDRVYDLPDATVEIATPGPNFENGDHQFLVQLTPAVHATAFSGSVWRLLLRNTGNTPATVDVWTMDGQPSPQVVFSGTSAHDSMKVGSPGCAGAAVTVASYTTRVEWTDFSGAQRTVGYTLNDISDFSSEGPLRNGASKPDVTAPGAMIVAAFSSASTPDPSSVVDDDHVVMAGTSMATPFISGVVALLLQHDPDLDPAGVKQFLGDHSRVPGMGAGAFEPKLGFGLLSLPEAGAP
jgi:subtilisin family serine protease